MRQRGPQLLQRLLARLLRRIPKKPPASSVRRRIIRERRPKPAGGPKRRALLWDRRRSYGQTAFSSSANRAPASGIQYSEHLDGDGAEIFAHACRLGAEGIVSKHCEHPYRSGPSKAWLKIKNPRAPGMLRFQDEP
jgi:hypothetical protein